VIAKSDRARAKGCYANNLSENIFGTSANFEWSRMASSNPPTTIRFRIGGRRTRGETACRMRAHCLFDTSDREAHSSLLRNMIFKNPIRSIHSAPDIVVVESARAFSARIQCQNTCVELFRRTTHPRNDVCSKKYAANTTLCGGAASRALSENTIVKITQS